MTTNWIRKAVNAGGTLVIRQALPNTPIFVGKMEWQHYEPVRGGIATSIEGAIENLEQALFLDSGSETPHPSI